MFSQRLRELFGKGNDETCTDMIYDTLQDTNVHLLMDSANGVVESVNILTWLLGKHGLNGFIDLDRSGVPAEILYQYAMNELIERQLVIVPFVHECLELIQKQKQEKAVHQQNLKILLTSLQSKTTVTGNHLS